jgi:thiamine kinase-like enzyme
MLSLPKKATPINLLQKIVYQDFFFNSRQPVPNQITFLANSNYKTSTFFVFENHTTYPLGILRVSNTREFVKKEYKILHHIYQYGKASIRNSIPRPIRLHQYGRRYIASQDYIYADKLNPPSWFLGKRKETVKCHLSMIRKWLRELWTIPVDNLFDDDIWGVDIFAELEYCFEKSNKNSDAIFKKILSIAENLEAKNLPIVLNHNDLCLENIFFDKNGIKVIDWELSYLTWPIYDWFYFVANYAYCLWAGRSIKTALVVKYIKKTFFESNWFSELVKDETKNIYADINLDKSLIPFFYCLGIFDFLYRACFPKLINIDTCAPLFAVENLYLTR